MFIEHNNICLDMFKRETFSFLIRLVKVWKTDASIEFNFHSTENKKKLEIMLKNAYIKILMFSALVTLFTWKLFQVHLVNCL